MPQTAEKQTQLSDSADIGPDVRAERARRESMAVRAVGDGVYDVVTADESVYTVDLSVGECTCPDYRYRGARCKHLRRVAIEVTAGRVPAPGQREASCADCGERFFAPETATDPVYCRACALSSGDLAVDRENGDLVVVAAVLNGRADEVSAGDGSVADYPGNEAYATADRVVEIVYPLPAGLSPEEIEDRKVRRYRFPRGRLRRVEADRGTDRDSE
jgi:hypothetical protein